MNLLELTLVYLLSRTIAVYITAFAMAGSVNSPTIEEARLRFPSFVYHPMYEILAPAMTA